MALSVLVSGCAGIDSREDGERANSAEPRGMPLAVGSTRPAPTAVPGKSAESIFPAIPSASGLGASPQAYRAALRAQLAQAYLEQGAPTVAVLEASTALELDPVNRNAAHLLALIAVQRMDLAEAQRYFERALAAPGAAGDAVLGKNYARFTCERLARRSAVTDCTSMRTRLDDPKSEVSGLPLLRPQSIAMDNSPASGADRRQVEQGQTGQSLQAADGPGHRRTRQKNSSEESRDE
ncbi:MAG: hypothetical protein WDN30_13510 [Pararobbsia sp.]